MRNITIIRLSALGIGLVLALTAFLATTASWYLWINLIFVIAAFPAYLLSVRTLPLPQFYELAIGLLAVLSFVGLLITSLEDSLVFCIILMIFNALLIYMLIWDRGKRKMLMALIMGD